MVVPDNIDHIIDQACVVNPMAMMLDPYNCVNSTFEALLGYDDSLPIGDF